MKNIHKTNGNVHITELLTKDNHKEGDWFISKEGDLHNNFGWNFGDRKVILTDNKDLIADGIQAIEDEVLEWITQNPNSEEVEVVEDTFTVKEMSKLPLGTRNLKYKIIIPQEEPNWEVLENSGLDKPFKLIEEPKQEPQFGTKEFNDLASRYFGGKQETLEEAAENSFLANKLANSNAVEKAHYIAGFREGAKWQEQRSYSKEEIIKAMKNGYGIKYFSEHTFLKNLDNLKKK
jgi:hypothetical protein